MSFRHIARAVVPRPVRNWLRAPARSVHWLWQDLRHRAGWDVTHTLRPGWTVRCHPGAYRTAYAPVLRDDEQIRELDAFIAACSPGMHLLDLGAHFGVFTLAALHFGGRKASAVAVDPSPTAVRMLEIQAALNGVEDRMHVVQAAVGARTGEMELVAAGVQAAGYFTAPTADHPAGERSRVRAVTVDDLVRTTRRRPTVVKIDVEGFEDDVLAGARALLRDIEAPVIFVELHVELARGLGRDASRALDLLLAAGYELADLGGALLSPARALTQPLIRLQAFPPGRSAA